MNTDLEWSGCGWLYGLAGMNEEAVEEIGGH